MKENRNGPDGRLSRRAGRFAAVFVMILMSVVAGIAKAQWVPFSGPDSVPDRGCHATVYDPVNDGIYMFGGSPSGTAGSHVNLCQRYDSAADTWTLMASMPDGRGWIQGAYCNGRIYIVAG